MIEPERFYDADVQSAQIAPVSVYSILTKINL